MKYFYDDLSRIWLILLVSHLVRIRPFSMLYKGIPEGNIIQNQKKSVLNKFHTVSTTLHLSDSPGVPKYDKFIDMEIDN